MGVPGDSWGGQGLPRGLEPGPPPGTAGVPLGALAGRAVRRPSSVLHPLGGGARAEPSLAQAELLRTAGSGCQGLGGLLGEPWPPPVRVLAWPPCSGSSSSSCAGPSFPSQLPGRWELGGPSEVVPPKPAQGGWVRRTACVPPPGPWGCRTEMGGFWGNRGCPARGQSQEGLGLPRCCGHRPKPTRQCRQGPDVARNLKSRQLLAELELKFTTKPRLFVPP